MIDSDSAYIAIYIIAFVLGGLCAMARWADIENNRTLASSAVGVVSNFAIYALMSAEMLRVHASYSYSFRAFILSLGITCWFSAGIGLSKKYFSRNRTDD